VRTIVRMDEGSAFVNGPTPRRLSAAPVDLRPSFVGSLAFSALGLLCGVSFLVAGGQATGVIVLASLCFVAVAAGVGASAPRFLRSRALVREGDLVLARVVSTSTDSLDMERPWFHHVGHYADKMAADMRQTLTFELDGRRGTVEWRGEVLELDGAVGARIYLLARADDQRVYIPTKGLLRFTASAHTGADPRRDQQLPELKISAARQDR
jgi:hypothetical protein